MLFFSFHNLKPHTVVLVATNGHSPRKQLVRISSHNPADRGEWAQSLPVTVQLASEQVPHLLKSIRVPQLMRGPYDGAARGSAIVSKGARL